jgi:glutamyl-tRNA synthetase
MPEFGAYVGRLAPSPTGALHLGNMRSFLIAWTHCRQHRGELLLRIEDLHTVRLKPGALEQIFDDLRWLGLDWDKGPLSLNDINLPEQDFVQSRQLQRYQKVLNELIHQGRAYPCSCTRKDIEMVQSAPHGEHELKYPGTCRDKKIPEHELLQYYGRRPSWRFVTDEYPTRYIDGMYGEQLSNVADWSGDFVIAQNTDLIAYQLAVVVDDHHHGVTHVLRGDDLLASTHRQLQLYRALGWQPPSFYHLPLLIGSDGKRLAKRHGDWKISTLRALGHSPEKIIGLIAWTLGLNESLQPMELTQFVDLFEIKNLQRTAFVLDSNVAASFLN